jgi:hypothetical protein
MSDIPQPISPMQIKCLAALASMTRPHGEMCVGFNPVTNATGMVRSDVRRSIRALARKGMAEFHKGLTTEDGDMAGAGYCVTPFGREQYLSRCGGGNNV